MGEETRIQVREVKKGAEAIGGIAERYMIRLLGPLGRRIEQATKAGRYMALLGVLSIIVSGILIWIYSLAIRTEVTRKGLEILVLRYEKEGYGIPFLAGVALLIIGLMQKRK